MFDLSKLGLGRVTGAGQPEAESESSPRRDRFQSLLAAAVCGVLVLFVVAGVRAYGDLADARAREAELEGLVAASDARIAELADRVERLREDDDTLERIAREELGMVFPDEAIVFLPPAAD